MVKPIPLFAFVFAAYAATNTGTVPISARQRKKIGVVENKFGNVQYPPTSVVPIWRTLLERSADICVKVGVLGDISGKQLDLASADRVPRDGVEEIWLSELSQTARGFAGVISHSASPKVKIGRKVCFKRDHVLDWTLRLSARKAGEACETLDEQEAPALRESIPT